MSKSDSTVLSEREQQLIAFAAEGLTDSAIAHKLGISEATVSTYWGRVRSKLGPFSRTELVARSIREESKSTVESLRLEIERLSEKLRVDTGEDIHDAHHNLYKDLIEVAADAIIIVNQDGQILNANSEAATLFGYDLSELKGLDMLQLVPDRYRMIHRAHRESYFAQPERKKMGEHLATFAKRKDGTEFTIAASLSSMVTSDGHVVICIVRPVARGY